jgi:hypothetical protein
MSCRAEAASCRKKSIVSIANAWRSSTFGNRRLSKLNVIRSRPVCNTR